MTAACLQETVVLVRLSERESLSLTQTACPGSAMHNCLQEEEQRREREEERREQDRLQVEQERLKQQFQEEKQAEKAKRAAEAGVSCPCLMQLD